jgi:hypothetical protein
MCVSDHLQLQALARHPEGLIRDILELGDLISVAGGHKL